jgi:hypothetical protein
VWVAGPGWYEFRPERDQQQHRQGLDTLDHPLE